VVQKLLIGVACLYLLLIAVGFLLQRKLLYPLDATYVTPAAAGLRDVEEVTIEAPDGARLIAWHGRAKPGQPTQLYFHGNGGSLAARKPRIERFMAEGWGVFMMTYRGYGGSTGTPSEADNFGDGVRAYDALVARGVAAGDIVLYGESLGTGVATRVALERPAAGLILDAPYTSIPDVAAAQFWFLPVRLFLREAYATAEIIGRIKTPLLILHGTRDRTIPVRMGRELFGLAPEPKTMAELPRGGHSDLYIDGNDALSHVRAFVHGLRR